MLDLSLVAEQAEAAEALDWTDFFIAEAGAAAALAGLVVVAVSINVKEILQWSRLVPRAAVSVTLFVNVLLIATFGLLPGVDDRVMGWLVLVPAGTTWISTIGISIKYGIDRDRRRQSVQQYAFWHLALIPLLIGAVLLITGNPDGLYWISAGIVLCYAVGILNAWVLLVEILR